MTKIILERLHKPWKSARWKVRQHGLSKRRSWRKVHLVYDESTHQILAISLTGNDIDDTSMLEPLLELVPLLISKGAADGAYDKKKSIIIYNNFRFKP